MLKTIEVQGRTEEEAIELALEQLGLSRDDVSVEILETAKSGLFGLKNTPAVIKVEYDSDAVSPLVEAVIEAARKENESAKTKRGASKSESTPDDEDSIAPSQKTDDKKSKKAKTTGAAAAADPDFCQRVDDYLSGLFKRMGLEVETEIAESDGVVNVKLTGSDPGVLIGRRGETLDALQHLTNYSINRNAEGRTKIYLDAENYRQRRSEALVSLASRTAGKVIKYRRNMTLDPMNAYERHIIHAALQDHDQVSTFSIGNDANRRVVVAYGKDKDSSSQSSGGSPQFKEWH